MGRKKRGGKATNARKGRHPKAVETMIIREEMSTQSPTESEESCSSGTPKSCNTPIDVDKSTLSPAMLVQHKKFGKFRCLLLDDTLKEKTAEASSSESEMQTDAPDIDPKDVENTEDTETLIEDLKAIEISDTDVAIVTVPVFAEEIIQEEVIEDLTEETVIELSPICDETEQQSFLPESGVKEIDFTINTVQLVSDESQEQTLPVEEIKTDNNAKTEEENIRNDESETDSNKRDSKVEETTTVVRRSSRIKSISVLKQRSKGHGLVKMEKKEKVKPKLIHSDLENLSDSNSNTTSSEKNNSMDSPSFVTPAIGIDAEQKPVKVKSRWRRSSELEMGGSSPITVSHSLASPQIIPEVSEGTAAVVAGDTVQKHQESQSPIIYDEEMENRLRQFQTLIENQYLTERTSCKEAKKMVCDCFLTKEEIERGEFGCGEDCLNRLLMIECGSQCCVGRRCTNKRFQKSQYAGSEVFRTEKKGFGIRATSDIKFGEFILEYVGEVLDPDEFDKRAKEYSKDKNRHYYFMALRADAVIDATQKGNISRFINHSCDPNAETQKWTVNGELRIGFFSKRSIVAGEEITFDYQFQRYGKEAQKCFCDSVNCRGWIGEEPGDDDDDDDDDDEDDDDDDDDDDEEEEEEDANDVIEEDKENSGRRDVETENDLRKQVQTHDVCVKDRKTVVKRQYKKRKYNKKQRKDIFEDLDLDEEIGMLSTTGVKNQAHTLKLSRLMVRAKDVETRMQLLKLLREGDLPCRRLFLDYHGLRLIYGWMCDAANMIDFENKNYSFSIEILQTLASLPIPNKTMLQDSKVLPTVEKWATNPKTEASASPIDSASNSPQIDPVTITTDIIIKKESPNMSKSEHMEESMEIVIREDRENKIELDVFDLVNPPEEIQVEVFKIDVKMEEQVITVVEDKREQNAIEIKDDDDDTEKQEEQEELKEKTKHVEKELLEKEKLEKQLKQEETERMEEKIKQEERERLEKIKEKEKANNKLMAVLIVKLLTDWAVLKEVFRIPKKERIEQMKEHEREADRDYKAALNLDQEISKRDARYSWKNERYKALEIERRKVKEEVEQKQQQQQQQQQQRILMKKGIRLDDRNIVQIPRLSKHERRQLFALQVAQEEQGRRRKHEQEMWRLHEQRCMVMGADPRLTSIEMAAAGYHYWNPATGQWQNFPPVPPNQQPPPPIFDMNCVVPQNRPSTQLPPHLMAANAINRPPMIQQAYQAQPPQPVIAKEEVTTFAGPIPPPVKLPPKWKCARDKYGRPYYYHIKDRVGQWEPPECTAPAAEPVMEPIEESSSSSESSSVSSDSSTDSDEDSESGDTRLLLEIRNKLKNIEATKASTSAAVVVVPAVLQTDSPKVDGCEKTVESGQKRKRDGLVQEIIISPRREEDKQAHKAELRKYKETKEKLRRQKQALMEQSKKRFKGKLSKISSKAKKHRSSKRHIKNLSSVDMNSEEAKRIKELFRSSMASVMVQNLNAFRKPECKMGRITNTEDFKHLARKLTHFVMLKELKHCQNIEDLTCNDSVKSKARDFVKKYMAKFGETYSRPKDEVD